MGDWNPSQHPRDEKGQFSGGDLKLLNPRTRERYQELAEQHGQHTQYATTKP